MWTLWKYCKERYTENDLKTQTESMAPEARQSLTEKIVRTLDQADDDDGSSRGENVEEILHQVEEELQVATQQLSVFEEKEQFLAVRIRKYQELLKQQEAHLQQSSHKQQSNNDNDNDNDNDATNTNKEQQQQQKHYREQVEKQQNNKQALGKVIDVHMDIMKHVKDCKRTIATLEQKKFDLTNVTKKCREFLVVAEEAEREQQRGIIGDDDDDDGEVRNDHHHHDLEMMEMAPTTPNHTNSERKSCRTNDDESDIIVEEEKAERGEIAQKRNGATIIDNESPTDSDDQTDSEPPPVEVKVDRDNNDIELPPGGEQNEGTAALAATAEPNEVPSVVEPEEMTNSN